MTGITFIYALQEEHGKISYVGRGDGNLINVQIDAGDTSLELYLDDTLAKELAN